MRLILDIFIVAGRKSALALYQPDFATKESGESICNRDAAAGFIKLYPEALGSTPSASK